MVEEDVQRWKIAECLGCSKGTIDHRLKKLGLRAKRTGPKNGNRHTNWKGGRKIVKGYVYIYSPSHPHKSKQNYVAEHRLAMEQKLGRLLDPKEVVHHRDGNRLNNHPDNLECFATNALHLADELNGKIPKWTEDGKKRIEAGIQKSARLKRNQCL
jgi:predicted transcriptional regulator